MIGYYYRKWLRYRDRIKTLKEAEQKFDLNWLRAEKRTNRRKSMFSGLK